MRRRKQRQQQQQRHSDGSISSISSDRAHVQIRVVGTISSSSVKTYCGQGVGPKCAVFDAGMAANLCHNQLEIGQGEGGIRLQLGYN